MYFRDDGLNVKYERWVRTDIENVSIMQYYIFELDSLCNKQCWMMFESNLYLLLIRVHKFQMVWYNYGRPKWIIITIA